MARQGEEAKKYFGELDLSEGDLARAHIWDPSSVTVYELTIASGESETTAFAVPPGARTMGMIVSTAWDETGELTFQTSHTLDPINWIDVVGLGGDLITIPNPPGRAVDLTNSGLMSFTYLKIRSYDRDTGLDFVQLGTPAWPEIRVIFK